MTCPMEQLVSQYFKHQYVPIKITVGQGWTNKMSSAKCPGEFEKYLLRETHENCSLASLILWPTRAWYQCCGLSCAKIHAHIL